MKTLPNIHPGEVLLEEFLAPLGMASPWAMAAIASERFSIASMACMRPDMSAAEMVAKALIAGSAPAASTVMKPPMLWPISTMRFGSSRNDRATSGWRR
ncbi:hypothetical protein RLIN73S_00803 [Rhodanobacter lindaniclasticus]